MNTYIEICEESARRRDVYWSNVGAIDKDVLASLPGAAFTEDSTWPSGRQAYRLVHLNSGTIIASEGMSDPYSDFDEQGASAQYQGLGVEYYIRTVDTLQASGPHGWQLQLLRNICQVTAREANLVNGFRAQNMYTISLSNPGLPAQFVDEEGFVGVLMGVMPHGPLSEPVHLPLEPTLMINCLLITTAELAHCMKYGKDGREEVCQRLLEQSFEGYSTLDRASVV